MNLFELKTDINDRFGREQRFIRRTREEGTEIGRLLLEAKDLCIEKDILFSEWCETNLSFSYRQAQRYMGFARGDADSSETNDSSAKSQPVDLGTPSSKVATVLGKLAKFSYKHTPDEIAIGMTHDQAMHSLDSIGHVRQWLTSIEKLILEAEKDATPPPQDVAKQI